MKTVESYLLTKSVNDFDLSCYSHDFLRVIEIGGLYNAYLFARQFGVVELSFPKNIHERRKHMDDVIRVFGQEAYIKMCSEFHGGRIKIPRGLEIQRQIEAMILADAIKSGELDAECAADLFRITLKTVQNRMREVELRHERK